MEVFTIVLHYNNVAKIKLQINIITTISQLKTILQQTTTQYNLPYDQIVFRFNDNIQLDNIVFTSNKYDEVSFTYYKSTLNGSNIYLYNQDTTTSKHVKNEEKKTNFDSEKMFVRKRFQDLAATHGVSEFSKIILSSHNPSPGFYFIPTDRALIKFLKELNPQLSFIDLYNFPLLKTLVTFHYTFNYPLLNKMVKMEYGNSYIYREGSINGIQTNSPYAVKKGKEGIVIYPLEGILSNYIVTNKLKEWALSYNK